MMNFTKFYQCVEEGARKVMSQHNFPSLTVAMLTIFLLGPGNSWLNAQSGYCDNPPNPLEVSVSPDISICLDGSTELSATAEGGILSLPRSFSIRVQPGNNLFVKEHLDGSDNEEIDMGTSIAYGAGDFGNGELYVIDIDSNVLVTIDTTTAARTEIGPIIPSEPGHTWAGLAYNEVTGLMYALSTDGFCGDSSIVYQVNLSTGQAVELYRLGIQCGLWLGIDPDGSAYTLNAIDSSLYEFDLLTGDMDLVGNIGTQVNFCQGADFDPLTGILYAAIYNSFLNETTFSIIDTETAELTPLSTVEGEYCVVALKNPGLKDYEFNWAPAAYLDDPNISNPVASPLTTTTYTVTVTDACGNTVTESVQVTVETPQPLDTTISCNMNVQVSVDQNCEAVITPDKILAGHYPCINEFFKVDVDNRGTNMVGPEDIDKVLEVKVTRLDSDGNPTGNSCWGTILVEDKLPPTIECTNDTLFCFEVWEPTEPIGFDNCGDVESIVLIDETITPIVCDEDFIQVVSREYIAIDSSGNESQPCTKQILLKRLDLSEVDFPQDFTKAGSNALACDEPYQTLPNGLPSPESTGYPQINGMDILTDIGQFCGVVATFEDNILPVINCKQKIVRVWTVREHWCNHHIIETHTQTIEIVDDEGPQIDCPADITVTTSTSHSCSADVFVEQPFAVDNCNEVDRIDLQYPGGFEANWTGGTISLPGGDNILTFTAYDNCAPNSSTCTTTVTVVDETEPIAVCKQTTVVSLTNDGTARVDAEAFDNGSFDECELSHMEVSRMFTGCDGEDPSFKPYVDFFCCDIAENNIQIILRVFDSSGNSNECMVEVEVQDKIPPAIVCPPNIEVSCQFPLDTDDLDVFGTVVRLDNLSDLQDPSLDPRGDIVIDDIGNPFENEPFFWGVDGYAYDNCDVSIEESENIEMDNCGTGTITRMFAAVGMDGTVGGQCVQTIEIVNYTPFTEDQIDWPESVTIHNACGPLDLDPDSTGFPEFDDDLCDMVHFSYSDQTFNISSPNDPACFKIVRTWTVIDWCQFENGQYVTWVRDQTIKVVNDVAPVITGDCDDVSICSFDPDCGDAYIELVQSAEDDCTEEEDLNWRYDIDVDNNGIFDLSSNNNPFADDPNDPTNASGTYPIGTHRIVWSVEDGCGNITTCSQLFSIINCTPPKAVCYDGLAVDLMDMDLNGDGQPDSAMLELQAHLLDAGSEHQCGYDVEFSFSSDPNDKLLPLGCDDLGLIMVPLYVTDENGNQSICMASVDVQDNNQSCPPSGGSSGSGPHGLVSGSVFMENGTPINDVEVNLMGSSMAPEMTDDLGNYDFPQMPLGGAYEVVPERDVDHRAGISTYDIALIQRHILGTHYFNTPYQWIAADIDRSGTIDVRDIAQLRRLILGTIDEFEQNTSWRFVDAEFQFSGFDPLNQNFNETYMIPDFNANMTGLDFIAVKVGDVNASYDPNSAEGANTRSLGDPLTLGIQRKGFEANQSFEIPVSAKGFRNVDAFQFTLLFNHNEMKLRAVEPGAINLGDEYVNFAQVADGLVPFSWNDVLPTTVSDDEVLFTLVFDAVESGNIAGSINMTSSKTPIRAYLNGEPHHMEFKFTDGITAEGGFELFQNRPNPFRDHTVISFNMAERADARITIMDVTGKVVYTVEDIFEAGYNEITVKELERLSSQVYYYRLDTDGYSATKKMIMMH
ncbi:MAG: T9SS C-terminal target domain-containing protein [Saprospirales bacterium]|nr:MAG: T9SS C-terminal target domain-containing protein [Saprospirales bacterium]